VDITTLWLYTGHMAPVVDITTVGLYTVHMSTHATRRGHKKLMGTLSQLNGQMCLYTVHMNTHSTRRGHNNRNYGETLSVKRANFSIYSTHE
jgi:hypothetical protein